MTSKGVVSGLAKTAVMLGVALALASPAKAEAQSFAVGVQFGAPVYASGYGYDLRAERYAHDRWEHERWERAQAEAYARQEQFREHERREQWRDHEAHERHEAWERERRYDDRRPY